MISLCENMFHRLRSFFPTVALISSITLFVIAGLYFNTIEAYLLYGAFLSAASTVYVLGSYQFVPQWRRHPAPIIIQRTVLNFIFSIILIGNFWDQGKLIHCGLMNIASVYV